MLVKKILKMHQISTIGQQYRYDTFFKLIYKEMSKFG